MDTIRTINIIHRRARMEFWNDPAVREVARQVLIALLLALLSVLGYDAAVVKPRVRRQLASRQRDSGGADE